MSAAPSLAEVLAEHDELERDEAREKAQSAFIIDMTRLEGSAREHRLNTEIDRARMNQRAASLSTVGRHATSVPAALELSDLLTLKLAYEVRRFERQGVDMRDRRRRVRKRVTNDDLTEVMRSIGLGDFTS